MHSRCAMRKLGETMNVMTGKKGQWSSAWGLFRRLRLFSKVSYSIGLDVGSRCAKMVVLKSEPRGLFLHDFVLLPLAEHTPGEQKHPILEQNQLLSLVCRGDDCLKQGIGIAVSGPSTFIRSLSLPMMSEEECRTHFHWELDRYISCPGEEVVWDLYTSEKNLATEPGQQSHFLVVAKAPFMKSQIQQWQECEIPVKFVDVAPFALVNMVTKSYGQSESCIVVHIGPSGMLLVALFQGEPCHIQEVPFEVEWYGEVVEQVFSQKREDLQDYSSESSERVLLDKFVEDITDQIGEMVQEIPDEYREMSLGKILLSGGYARVNGLKEQISGAFESSVEYIDPFRHMTVSEDMREAPLFQRALPLLSIAAGVAIREALPHDSN